MSIDRLGHHTTNEATRTYLHNADGARAASTAAPEATDAAGASRRPDSVILSNNARTLATARAAVQNAADVRHDKVADIKQRVQDGTYDVPAHVLARKLLQTSTQ